MGLDNGFMVKGIHHGEAGYVNELPSFVKLPFSSTDNQISLCYWRKCWGLRRAINATLHLAPDQYEMKIDREDIPAIVRVIKYFLHEENWNREAESIWTYDEMIDNNLQSIMNLMWLYDYWATHPYIEVTWYDSY